jgi:mannose-1-phosphate guanylyltransferase/phosphomannomutase
VSPEEPEEIEILFAEPPGIPLDVKTERKIENYFHREDFRRAFHDEMGTIVFPPRLHEMYVGSLLQALEVERIRNRGMRVVVDYSYSAASRLLAGVLERLGVEILSVNAFSDGTPAGKFSEHLPQAVKRVRRLVEAMEADVGVILDPGAEHLLVLDEHGDLIEDEKLLLLLLAHACREQGPGSVVLPLHITHRAEQVAEECGSTVRRTRSSDAMVMAEATRPHTIFAATVGGGYIFPGFLPSMDALLTVGKVLELTATAAQPLSELRLQVPEVHVLHALVNCPWQVKGAVMRLMVEELKDEQISLVDGIKVAIQDDEWVQFLPDADDPLFHVYAEAGDDIRAQDILLSYKERLIAIIEERRLAEV